MPRNVFSTYCVANLEYLICEMKRCYITCRGQYDLIKYRLRERKIRLEIRWRCLQGSQNLELRLMNVFDSHVGQKSVITGEIGEETGRARGAMIFQGHDLCKVLRKEFGSLSHFFSDLDTLIN
jgi:hypothetical protein